MQSFLSNRRVEVRRNPPRNVQELDAEAFRGGGEENLRACLWKPKSSQVTYLFSEGTYVSIYDVSPHYGPPSAISIDSRPPLLASGAHSIGFRTMVVCCLCIDLT